MKFLLPSLPSLRSLLNSVSVGSLLTQATFVQKPQLEYASSFAIEPFANAPECPVDGPLSCHSNSVEASCCFITPGGQFLQTQFWDASPAIGPVDSWTLHGLWPDLCDGSYEKYCNSAPKYYNITQILASSAQDELLAYMKIYWLPNQGSMENFWEHEWNKHGTCINTLSPECYGDDYTAGAEVVDFFTRAVELFKSLDTYSALAAAGITPSNHKTYTAMEIQDALTKVTGSEVVLGCRGHALNQAWYSYNVRGSLQTGDFVPTDPVGSGKGSCPQRGIKYLPK